MKTNLMVLVLILVAALWRVAIVFDPSLSNVAPVTALAFCAAAYFSDWRWWLVPFLALLVSDLWLNHYHATQFGYTWSQGEMLLRLACVAAAVGLGRLVARRRSLPMLAAGALASSLLFYLGTNSVSWFADPFYARTAAGWWQAMTIGHPEFPPTLWFFRNTLTGDIVFTGLFVLAHEFATGRVPVAAREEACR